MTDGASVAVEARGIVKRFGSVCAVDGVDLDLVRGEIHALCGENGAGKSTLARIVAGTLAPTSGSVLRTGAVGLVHQHFELVDRLRVWENVVLGREPRRGLRLDATAARERVRMPIRELGVANAALFATLRELAARGAAILVITHKLAEVIAHADRVTVMRAGRVVMRSATAATSLEAIARAMVGGEVPGLAPRSGVAPRPAFAARALSAGGGAHALRSATFEVRGGEIVGIAGVEGNGQSALTDAIAGMLPYEGEMSLGEQPLRGDPAARIAAGVRIIPQDRQREGLVLGWSIVDNVALGDQTRPPLARGWTIDRNAAAALATQIVERFDVRTPSIRTSVASLSGGNQQKVVVGRALAHAPRFVVAYQPTRGIDVGAAALVQSRLIEARNAGTAVLLVSFELDEVLALSDRVLVLYRGAIAGAFERAAFDRARIGALMAGAA